MDTQTMTRDDLAQLALPEEKLNKLPMVLLPLYW